MRKKADSDNEKMDEGKNRLVEVGGDVNVMISKNISNDENKVSNKDWGLATPSPRLENESAEEVEIKSNGSIGEVDVRNLDNLEVEVDRLLLRNSGSDKTIMIPNIIINITIFHIISPTNINHDFTVVICLCIWCFITELSLLLLCRNSLSST
ncbi:10531_t:CDS:2 [Gigaspora rosea]|nr:10531_t:CDS:2 [Gigaspora rosea]